MLLLSNTHIKILKKCLEHYRKDLLWIIESEKIINIDQTIGNELQEAVGNELIEYGLYGDVPNQYGFLLEDLIDVIGNFFID